MNKHAAHSHTILRSLKAQFDALRTPSEKIADWMTKTFGNIFFLIFNGLYFLVWIVWNIELIPGLIPFDPYPFGLLTTIVSLEAIILAIFVLISQNRVSKIDDLREEIDLQVDIITEQEVTKLMKMVTRLMEHQGMDMSKDKVLISMLKPTNMEKIRSGLEHEVTE